MKLIRFFITLIILSLSFQICAKTKQLSVVTSSSPIASIFYMVLGDIGTVEYLAKSHGCSHDYHMKPSQLNLLKNADIIAYIDDNFDGFIIQNVQQNSAYILKFSKLPLELIKNENGLVNWHIWLKIKNVRLILDEILNILVKTSPQHTEQFVSNYQKALKNLELIERRIENLGETKNILLLGESLEYLFDNFKTATDKKFLGNKQPTLKYINDIRESFSNSSKICLVLDAQHQSEKYYTDILNDSKVKIVALNAENWLFEKDLDKQQLYYGEFQLMLNSIMSCF